MSKTAAESLFLDSLGIHDSDQDHVDLEYLKDVHWETWAKCILASAVQHGGLMNTELQPEDLGDE